MLKLTVCTALIAIAMTGSAMADHCYISGISNINLGRIDIRNIGNELKGDGTITLRCEFKTKPSDVHYCITNYDVAMNRYIEHTTEHNIEHRIPFALEDNIVGTVKKPLTGVKELHVPIPFRVTLRPSGGDKILTGEYIGWFGYKIHSAYGKPKAPDQESMCKDGRVDYYEKLDQNPFMGRSIKANIANPCSIRVERDMDFGIIPLLDKPRTATGTVRVSCAEKTPYEIGIGPGNNSEANVRFMKCDSSVTCKDFKLPYDLYQDSNYMQRWTNEWATGNVVRSSDQQGSFNVYGRLTPLRNTLPGSYSDQVVVEVKWLAK